MNTARQRICDRLPVCSELATRRVVAPLLLVFGLALAACSGGAAPATAPEPALPASSAPASSAPASSAPASSAPASSAPAQAPAAEGLDAQCRARVEGPESDGECTADADCATGGCSGEICATGAALQGLMTTCEVLPCFERLDACGCQDGRCSWTLKAASEDG